MPPTNRNAVQLRSYSGSMPKNCSVPLCTSNAKKNPDLAYHEFPSDAERQQAWLRNISRQGSGGKETRWVPSDHSLVCSLHFTENDYKKGAKLRMLLPTAIPKVFPNYPSYMQKVSTPRIRKRPRRELSDDSASVRANNSDPEESMHGDLGHDLFSEQEHVAPVGFSEETSDSALPADSEQQTSSTTDKTSQTDLDLKRTMEEAKITTNRLQRKISRLKHSLQSQHDTVRERLQAFESNKEIASFLSLLKAAN